MPLRKLMVSDFRRLSGTRTFSLDAPIVLIHGPNGTGKTSILSAIELALTGEIRSMLRHDSRYTAHLPYQGQDFATLGIEVSPELSEGRALDRMTVGGSRIEGAPALDPEARRFYSERCYLDQVSLGQLLDLYQYREGKEESALARFVNELLGLEQLDALRMGLAPAGDFRNLKNVANLLIEAELQAKQASNELAEASESLENAESVLSQVQSELVDAAIDLGLSTAEQNFQAFISSLGGRLGELGDPASLAQARDLQQSLTATGGRVSALSNLPSVQHLDQARQELTTSRAALDRWRDGPGVSVEAWAAEARAHGIEIRNGGAESLDREIATIDRTLQQQRELVAQGGILDEEVGAASEALSTLEAELADAQEEAGSLAEGLAALRPHLANNACPVCGRDFGEVSATHLSAHVEAKINELTSQGARLRDLRARRATAATELERRRQAVRQVEAARLSAPDLEAMTRRRRTLTELRSRFEALSSAISDGRELRRAERRAAEVVQELEATTLEVRRVQAELDEAASALSLPAPQLGEPLARAWERLAAASAQQVQDAEAKAAGVARVRGLLHRSVDSEHSVRGLKDVVARAARRKRLWDAQLREARRRQKIAREVAQAASTARAAIVQRVFTESLNEMWRSVFSRLAPRETFIPEFGIPSSSKGGLELTLQTVHSSGEIGGSPQMMLSAGNLNTAALSLFIALHLGVSPIVPCLVFDDPVQSMDEVHVSQFAGLMRVLSKHHSRQIVIAVHERELFDYLTLELSPAFPGDELLTIELGSTSEDSQDGSQRHIWEPDASLAV